MIWSILAEAFEILRESAIYLIAGFALAGLTHVYLGYNAALTAKLAGGGRWSILTAALLGMPLPLCSCSVLPAGLSLRERGASKGTTSSFLISVPETDVVSVILTWGLIGPALAIARPVAALVTAVTTGMFVDAVEGRLGAGKAITEGGAHEATEKPQSEGASRADRPWYVSAWRFGFGSFFDDLVGQLLLGILIAGAAATFLPQLDALGLETGSWWTYLAMVAVGLPMYVCATASTPIAVGLIAGGLSPGAALVFLLAGPATNTASVIVLLRRFGKWATLAYLVPVLVLSVLAGVAFDGLFPAPPDLTAPVVGATVGLLQTAGLIAFLALVARSLYRTRTIERGVHRISARLGWHPSSRQIWGALGAAALVLWLSSGLVVLRPGERAVETRFGEIMSADLGPGLHVHWPRPIGKVEVVDVERVRTVDFGVDVVPVGTPIDPEEEAKDWLLTGDENFTDIQFSVHYRVRSAGVRDFVYGTAQPEALLRAGAERALAAAIGTRGIDSLLTVDRHEIEQEVSGSFLQPFLDECGAGIEVVDVNLLEVHAPPPVHWAFRDVASAAEDEARAINQAEEYAAKIVEEAYGEAARIRTDAYASAALSTQHAHGEATAFLERQRAHAIDPALTRQRLYLEWLDLVLPRSTKYVDLTPDADLDLWLGGRTGSTLPMLPEPDASTGGNERLEETQ